ncbi:Family of unknown function (DUF662 [Striga hermonthica]|uniref:RAB6-interacting golgin n=1 Tax=Striga hermonthica TaxID=68872 RepID=A0A9N7MMD2_STRHE|nr:Family of unknown function (DUF662 [Striga hermonthica]
MESPLLTQDKKEEEDLTKSAMAAFRAKEDEIEKKKTEMRGKIEAQLGRVEEEAKRLAVIHAELDAVNDPMRKEAEAICKKIDIITRDLKSLGLHCQKKEKEYKEAVEALNEKNQEKTQLVAKLVELVTESEELRLKKLEELCNDI